MSHENPFVLPKEQYTRDINVLKHYVQHQTNYLAMMTGKPADECKRYVMTAIRPGGVFEFKDPGVVYLERGDNGDRVERQGTMSEYLSTTISRKELIAPTFTTYLNPKVKKSVLVDFIDRNVKARGAAKKAMFKAKMAGDHETEVLKKTEQTNKKLANNAISGAHVSNSTPLFNKTAHSTLTSNCRTTSGFGNANNEKILNGNRHYWNPNIVINNIVSIVGHTDYAQLVATMTKYGIRYPTVEETIECVTYSTNLYWRNVHAMRRITALINRLSPEQRAAFVYTGDLYHLKKCNDAFVRQFIGDLTKTVKEQHPDPKAVLKNSREEYHNLVKQFFPKEMRGKVLGEAEKTFIGLTDPQTYGYIASTIENIHKAITVDYSDFIKTFFVTTNVPASLSYFPLSIRRAALTSDTDSTIFTVQDWVHWYQNSSAFDDVSSAVSATMIFFAAETITHVLARMSANFGIETERIHQVAMKNEFKFDVFVPTQVGKHYFAVQTAVEGNIAKDFEMEIKGVHLKSSNVPKQIMKQAEEMMKDIIETVLAGKKIVLTEKLRFVADLEREVKRSVLAGEPTYFRKGQIKIPQSYVNGVDAPAYQNHLLWAEVFAPKYGNVAPPPYGGLKISVDLGSKVSLLKWANAIKDKELGERLKVYLERTKKNALTTLLFSEEALRAGMPEEIAMVLDIRKIVFEVTSVFYLILETLGFYSVNKNLTRLISDEY